MFAQNAIFKGALLHRRYAPTRHHLTYHVTDVLVDVDKLEDLNSASWLIGYNRTRLFTINDRNHGSGDGTPIADNIRMQMGRLALQEPVTRIFMLCYPAVLGRVFNPLTVYFGLGDDGRWLAVVYEVSNTFGQRHSYVMAVGNGTDHRAEKRFCVSPFNGVEGEYRFSIERHEKYLRLNIALFERQKLILSARFEGHEQHLNDRVLMRGLLGLAIQPFKVVAAIHWEALKLYLKGLRPASHRIHTRFPPSTNYDDKNRRFKPCP